MIEKTNLPWTENTKGVRDLLKGTGFTPLPYFQGKRFLKPIITKWANKDREWLEKEYSTFDNPEDRNDLATEMLNAEDFISEIKKL